MEYIYSILSYLFLVLGVVLIAIFLIRYLTWARKRDKDAEKYLKATLTYAIEEYDVEDLKHALTLLNQFDYERLESSNQIEYLAIVTLIKGKLLMHEYLSKQTETIKSTPDE